MLSMACSPDMTLFLPDSQNSGWTASPSLPVLPSIMTPLIFLEQLKCISALGFCIHRDFSLKGFSLKYFLSLKFLLKFLSHNRSLLPHSDTILLWSRVFPSILLCCFILLYRKNVRTAIYVKLFKLFVVIFLLQTEQKLSGSCVILLLHGSQNTGILQTSRPEHRILEVCGLKRAQDHFRKWLSLREVRLGLGKSWRNMNNKTVKQ